MPVLIRNTYGEKRDGHWSRGVESVGFSAWGYKGTDSYNPVPQVIDLKYLQSHPLNIPAFRRVARLALIDSTNPDLKNTQSTRDITQILSGCAINEIGSITEEQTDEGRTTNYIIPLNTTKGLLQVVVNGAWGVSWRLGKDHFLVKNNRTLEECQPVDISQGLGDQKQGGQSYYLSPDNLEGVTKEQIDPKKLAQRIQEYLQELLKLSITGEVKHQETRASQSSGHRNEENIHIFGLETDTSKKNMPIIGINFELGNNEGIKSLDIFGYTRDGISHPLDALAKEGYDIGELIRSFYHPTK